MLEDDNDFDSDDDQSWGSSGDAVAKKRQFSIEETVAEGIAKARAEAENITDEQVQEVLDQMDEGKTLAEIKNIPSDSLELLYAFGYRFYKAKRFQDAAQFFQQLILLDHLDTRFYFGLAGCRQGLKEYAGALDIYSVLFVLDGENPVVALNAGICCLGMGELDKAQAALEMACGQVADQLEYDPGLKPIGEKALALLKNVEERMQEQQKKPAKK